MEKLKNIISTAVPLEEEDVDTDQIIPARFLKLTDKSGFGDNLFRDWRYLSDGSLNKTFILNHPEYSGKILVAGKNFGCGSSREHAAWALYQYGFRVVISSGFADIFRGNALNNGILPVEVDVSIVNDILKALIENPKLIINIDIESQTLKIENIGVNIIFDLDPYKKICLINGYDDVDYLISIKDKIEAYETSVAKTPELI